MFIFSVALFAWLISHTFSANGQYFSLTTNQRTIFSGMTFLGKRTGHQNLCPGCYFHASLLKFLFISKFSVSETTLPSKPKPAASSDKSKAQSKTAAGNKKLTC
jgi:hypothetical protein